MPRVEPTAEQLQAAFAAVRLPAWPTDFAEAMRHEVRRAIVHGAAGRLAMGSTLPRRDPPLQQRPPVTRPEPPPWRPAPGTAHSTGIDRKRAAAGDKDD
jgi:hypothetical protein